MTKVVLTSWNKEMQQVLSFTKLQNRILGLSMRESFDNSNAVLEGNKVILEIDSSIAKQFIEQATSYGVKCHLEE